MAACTVQYRTLVKETQQVEYQLETLLVKYTMTKETALSEIYNLTSSNTIQSPVDTKAQTAPVSYSTEQQVLILGLLRFKVVTHEHFRTIFGEQKLRPSSSNSPSADHEADLPAAFIDTAKEVPFVSCDLESNSELVNLAPAFQKLEEMHKQIKGAKEKLKEVELKKGATYFRRAAEAKRIGQHRSDKRELLDLINQLQANLKEVVDRKTEIVRRHQVK